MCWCCNTTWANLTVSDSHSGFVWKEVLNWTDMRMVNIFGKLLLQGNLRPIFKFAVGLIHSVVIESSLDYGWISKWLWIEFGGDFGVDYGLISDWIMDGFRNGLWMDFRVWPLCVFLDVGWWMSSTASMVPCSATNLSWQCASGAEQQDKKTKQKKQTRVYVCKYVCSTRA